MAKNKLLKRFLRANGIKIEDMLDKADVIQVVSTLTECKELKLDDLLPDINARNISQQDFEAFVKRVAKRNSWNLEMMFSKPAEPVQPAQSSKA